MREKYFKKQNPGARGIVLFCGLFREGAERLGGELHLHSIHSFRLDVDLEGSSRGDIRVTTGISGFRAASGHLAGSAHNRS